MLYSNSRSLLAISMIVSVTDITSIFCYNNAFQFIRALELRLLILQLVLTTVVTGVPFGSRLWCHDLYSIACVAD